MELYNLVLDDRIKFHMNESRIYMKYEHELFRKEVHAVNKKVLFSTKLDGNVSIPMTEDQCRKCIYLILQHKAILQFDSIRENNKQNIFILEDKVHFCLLGIINKYL
jgi:hypothetical protein